MMKNFYWLIAFFILLFLLATGVLTAQEKATRTDLTVSQFKEYVAKQSAAVVLDVRTPEEFAAGHLENAVNISVTDPDFDTKVSAFAKDKAVLIYCRTGRRSVTASDNLLALGFLYVFNLDKGITGWQTAGEKVVK